MKTYVVKVEDSDFKPIDKNWPELKGKISLAYLICGEELSIVISKSYHGAEFDDSTPHDVEEIIYLLQGGIEYEDGRILKGGGMATINLVGQPHKGKYVSDDPDKPIIELAIRRKFPEKFRKEFKVIAQRNS